MVYKIVLTAFVLFFNANNLASDVASSADGLRRRNISRAIIEKPAEKVASGKKMLDAGKKSCCNTAIALVAGAVGWCIHKNCWE